MSSAIVGYESELQSVFDEWRQAPFEALGCPESPLIPVRFNALFGSSLGRTSDERMDAIRALVRRECENRGSQDVRIT
jgi:hypothetical protein